jgi:hypothetical protein
MRSGPNDRHMDRISHTDYLSPKPNQSRHQVCYDPMRRHVHQRVRRVSAVDHGHAGHSASSQGHRPNTAPRCPYSGATLFVRRGASWCRCSFCWKCLWSWSVVLGCLLVLWYFVVVLIFVRFFVNKLDNSLLLN